MSPPGPDGSGLADAVPAAGVGLLEAAVPDAAAVQLSGGLRLEAGLDLGAGRWVCVVRDDRCRWTVPLVYDGHRARRARPGDGVAEALIDLLAAGGGQHGAFSVTRWTGRPLRGERAVGVDQTNESVIVGDAAVVKWCTALGPLARPYEHPAAQRLALLVRAGFTSTPLPWGMMQFATGEPNPLLLASVAQYLPGSMDGWDWAVADVLDLAGGRLSERAALAPAEQIGRLAAELHLALAAGGVRAATRAESTGWAERAHADLDRALTLVGGDEGTRLAALAPRARAAMAPLDAAAGTPVMAVHGDLHIGQMLRHGEPAAYAVIDFDGNPVLAADQRAAPAPAAVDVASLLASIDHVGRVAARRLGRPDPSVGGWATQSESVLFAAYRVTLAAHGRPDLLDERLLLPLRVHQECREYLYAELHLPRWRYVPDQAMPALLGAERG